MTKPRPPHVEPTSGTNYSIYLWPRSKDPRRDAIYTRLHDLGWRYDHTTAMFWTPEDSPLREAFGALETHPDYLWAHIAPPSTFGGEVCRASGRCLSEDNCLGHRPSPLLILEMT